MQLNDSRRLSNYKLISVNGPDALIDDYNDRIVQTSEIVVENIETLFDKTVGEIERILSTKTVVGEPIIHGGNTLIPLVNVGFGFGVGAGQGSEPNKSSGQGGGTGGGGGIKPVALVIINDEGVRLEAVKSGTASVIEKVAQSLGKMSAEKGKTDT